MNHSFKKNTFHIQNDDSKNLFQLGGSMILGPKFDIKKYLNNINYQPKSVKKEEKHLPPLFDNLYKRSKDDNKRYNLSTIENLPSHRNNVIRIRKPLPSLDISTTISYNNNSNTLKNNKNSSKTLNTNYDNNSLINVNLKLNKNSSRKTYFESDKNLESLDLYKKYPFENNDEKFNFAKAIKTIKKFADLSRRDKSIKNIVENRIAYDPKNLDVIYKPIKLINGYQNYQNNLLNKNKDNISTFLTENNEISKKNLLIKLLESQKIGYNNDINERKKKIDNNKILLESYENEFANYLNNQKKSSRKIDDLLTKLIIANRLLIKENYNLKSEMRIKEDERQKLLERIDELRIIAKFVTIVLDGNPEIFNKAIIPEYSSERLPNYELISKELFERFSFLLNEKENLSQEEINMIEQMNHLNDSELLYKQFNRIEEDIINTLQNKESIIVEIADIKNEGKKQTKDIQKRIEDLKNELNSYKSIYEKEKKEYEEIYKRNYSGEGEFDSLIKELYLEVMNIENTKKNIINIPRAVEDIKKEIIEKELNINKLQMLLEQYEENDKYLFDRIVYKRKTDIKEMKVSIQKRKIEAGEREKLEHLRPMEKITFIQRKCEPPYRPPKKEKKEIIDYELIQKLENEELLTYE